jgi:preprotein translocase subunit YajC
MDTSPVTMFFIILTLILIPAGLIGYMYFVLMKGDKKAREEK